MKSGKQRDPNSLDGTLTADGHHYRARVYFADTDFSGAVYHARFLEFMERGRSDYLRLSGVHHTDLAAGIDGAEPMFWVVRHMEIDFRGQGAIDDILDIHSTVEELAGARIVMGQSIKRGDDLLLTARVTAALVNADGKPRRMPKVLAAQLSGGNVAKPTQK